MSCVDVCRCMYVCICVDVCICMFVSIYINVCICFLGLGIYLRFFMVGKV